MHPIAVLAAWMSCRFAKDERGNSMVEYALLIALIVVVCIAAMSAFGSAISSSVDDSATQLGAT